MNIKTIFYRMICVCFCLSSIANAGETEDPAKIVAELCDVIYSNAPLTASLEMRFFPPTRNDARSCLRATHEYVDSEAPILEFLRSQRVDLFKTDIREDIAVFSASHVLGKSGEVSSHDFVFAMVRWDKRSATPPVLMVQFIFSRKDEGVILSGPDFIEAAATISLFDAALQYRDSTKK